MQTTKDMTLVEILTAETQSLKVQYIEKTKEYAEKFFAKIAEEIKKDDTYWMDKFGVKYEETLVHFSDGKRMVNRPVKSEYHKKTLYKMRNEKDKFQKIVGLGFEKFLAKELKSAADHYEDSIAKLARRIEIKGLNQDALTVKTSHIGVNIDTVLTDGTKTVRAFTIIASGEIQRPHYRYLIK